MKIVSLDNIQYEIDDNENDDVLTIKKKLSEIIFVSYDNIGLVYKNHILYDNTLIKDHKIAPDEFVLLCIISQSSNFTEKVEQYDETDSSVESTGKLDIYRSITVQVNSVTENKLYLVKVTPDDTIFDAFKYLFKEWKYLYFTFNDQPLYTTRRFCDYNIDDDDLIMMSHIQTGNPFFLNQTFISLHYNYSSLDIFIIPRSTMLQIKSQLSQELDIPTKNILFYRDEKQEVPIEDDECLEEPILIFYNIIADFQNIIKRKILGRGTYGSVYKCTELDSNKEFALKEFKFSNNDLSELATFHKEIAILCSLGTHPRIVKFEKKFIEETALYILMEYVAGGSLGKYLKTNGPMSEREIMNLSREILEALEYLHSHAVVHRDVKGDNVLLDQDKHVKICDFSVSKVLIHAATKGFLNGAAKSFVGTANWMAPEIINGQKYGPKADIWSFGATVVEMLTGKPPYHQLGYYSVIFKVGLEKKIDYTIPMSFNEHFKSFLDSCLHSEPSKRLSPQALLKLPFLNLD